MEGRRWRGRSIPQGRWAEGQLTIIGGHPAGFLQVRILKDFKVSGMSTSVTAESKWFTERSGRRIMGQRLAANGARWLVERKGGANTNRHTTTFPDSKVIHR